MRWQDALNPLAVFGFAAFLASLSMTWGLRRSCPLFEECGPWEAQAGWEMAGWPAVAVLGAVVLAQGLLQRRAAARDGAMVVVATVAAAGLAFLSQWGDFAIFGDARFPLAGFWVAVAGIALAACASVASLAAAPSMTRGTGLPPDLP